MQTELYIHVLLICMILAQLLQVMAGYQLVQWLYWVFLAVLLLLLLPAGCVLPVSIRKLLLCAPSIKHIIIRLLTLLANFYTYSNTNTLDQFRQSSSSNTAKNTQYSHCTS